MNANLYALFQSRFPQDLEACWLETDDGLYYSWRDLERAERRKGGETGVKSVQLLEGEAAWNAPYSKELLIAAVRSNDDPEVRAWRCKSKNPLKP